MFVRAVASMLRIAIGLFRHGSSQKHERTQHESFDEKASDIHNLVNILYVLAWVMEN